MAWRVLAAAVLAPRLRMPPPLLLVLMGLLLGFVPALRAIELPPETVLLLFLPVLLFWENLTTSLRSIRRDFRGIVILSTLLVVATAFGVAALAAALGMPWEAALVLGRVLGVRGAGISVLMLTLLCRYSVRELPTYRSDDAPSFGGVVPRAA